MSIEERVRTLEGMVQSLAELAELQAREIERLRMELSDEITANAIARIQRERLVTTTMLGY